MEKIKYPLLYFELSEDKYLGKLVGTEYEAMASDLERLKLKILNHLKREYRKYRDFPDVRLRRAKMKVLNVSYRPAFRNNSGVYPLPYSLNIPVPAIFGETIYGYYECYLPLFNSEFPYYEAKHLEPLAVHQANAYLNSYEPERIYNLMRYGEPKLDFILLRVKDDDEFEWENAVYRKSYDTLNRLTDRYPFPKAVQKNLSQGPDAAWEREKEVELVVDKMIQTRSNLIIVGEPGSGKSAVLQQAIKKAINRTRSWSYDLTFWRILPQRITASTKYLGEWEETAENIVQELESAHGILWVISLIKLLEIGGAGPEDSVAAFFRPYLQQGKLQIISEATPQELESMRRLLPSFIESFQIIELEKLGEENIHAIHQKYVEYAEKNLRISIDESAVKTAYQLLNQYYPYENFPGKGIKFLSKCISKAQLVQDGQVNKERVIETFVEETGMPELFLRDDLHLDQEDLQAFFEQRIIGQPQAVATMTNLVKVFKAGLNAPDRPIATLIFAGPTGVGKTASAKTLADYFFGQGQKKTPLIRIDMSEFRHPAQIARLIGAGKETGTVIKEIRERPFSVLLLDEIEKADSSIFDALLTVLDEGLLVDAFGRETNFKNTIIIMTSNLGASNQKPIGLLNTTDPELNYQSAIQKNFRPEFVNRIDGVVIFNTLDEAHIKMITLKELEELKKRDGFVKKNIEVRFSERVVEHISRIGFDERFGARPLQRAIEQSLVNPIASWILENNETGNCMLLVDFDQQLKIKRLKK